MGFFLAFVYTHSFGLPTLVYINWRVFEKWAQMYFRISQGTFVHFCVGLSKSLCCCCSYDAVIIITVWSLTYTIYRLRICFFLLSNSTWETRLIGINFCSRRRQHFVDSFDVCTRFLTKKTVFGLFKLFWHEIPA